MIKIIIHKKSKAIKILGPIFQKELAKIGYKTQLITCEDLNQITHESNDIFFVFTPHKFLKFRRNKYNRKAKLILYQQEQLSNTTKDGILRIQQLKKIIDHYDIIIDVSNINKKFYKKLHRKIDFIIPTAYHKNFEILNKKKLVKYDCLFFGRYSDKPRRISIIEKLKMQINFYPKYEKIYGKNLFKAIQESKIILNIHQSELKFPEWLRLILGIANKKLVISEPTLNIRPLQKNNHIIMSKWQDIPKIVNYYKNNNKEYKKITNESYNFIKNNYRMDNIIKEFADKILYHIYYESNNNRIKKL